MTTRRIISALLPLALLAALTTGCMWQRVEPEPARTDPALDPCPSRLHSIEGAILLYCVARQTMPPDLAAIKLAGGDRCPPLECPVSGRPYVYVPEGLEIAGQAGRVILYDALPVHDGRRWALVMNPQPIGAHLDLRVVLLPKGAVAAPPPASPADPRGR